MVRINKERKYTLPVKFIVTGKFYEIKYLNPNESHKNTGYTSRPGGI